MQFFVAGHYREGYDAARRAGFYRTGFVVLSSFDGEAARRLQGRSLTEDDVRLVNGWGRGPYAHEITQELRIRGVDTARVRYAV